MKKIIKKTAILLAIAVIGTASLVGCGAEDKFIGSWHNVKLVKANGEECDTDFSESGIGLQLEIKEDGRYKHITVLDDTDVIDGNWELNDETRISLKVKGKEFATVEFMEDDKLKFMLSNTDPDSYLILVRDQ